MSTAKKYKNYYPNDSPRKAKSDDDVSSLEEKRLIEAYLKKITKLLEDDPNMQKKAALIISEMINNKKK